MPCLYVAYLRDSRLLRALARVLELPAVACTTAFTYLHRIRLLQHEIQLTGQVRCPVNQFNEVPDQFLGPGGAPLLLSSPLTAFAGAGYSMYLCGRQS